MNADQFNVKYKDYLEGKHYGCDLDDERIIDYLDKEFQELIKIPGFQYSQIKQKFSTFRFYCDKVPNEKVDEITSKMLEIQNSPNENRQLVYNAVKCLECGETIESANRHDYKTCSCENQAMVDGGLDYVRYGAKDMSKVVTISHYYDEPHDIIRNFAFRSGHGKDGKGPYQITRIADMSDEYLKSAMEYLIKLGISRKSWALDILYKELGYRTTHNISIKE